MGTNMYDVVTVPFMAALDFSDNISLKYEHAARCMIHQEEVRLKVANKAIGMRHYLEHEISGPYFQIHHHDVMATEDLHASLMEIFDYHQDLSNNSHQVAMNAYYDVQSTTSKIAMLKSQVVLCISITHQDMLKSLSEGQFASNAAIEKFKLQLYYNN
jgi:hypothetical protein